MTGKNTVPFQVSQSSSEVEDYTQDTRLVARLTALIARAKADHDYTVDRESFRQSSVVFSLEGAEQLEVRRIEVAKLLNSASTKGEKQ